MLSASLRCARRYRRGGRRGSGPGRPASPANPPRTSPVFSLQRPRPLNSATHCTPPSASLDSPCTFLSSSYSLSAPIHFSCLPFCLPHHPLHIPLHPPVSSLNLLVLPQPLHHFTCSVPLLCTPFPAPASRPCIPIPKPASARFFICLPGPLLLLTPLTTELCPPCPQPPHGREFSSLRGCPLKGHAGQVPQMLLLYLQLLGVPPKCQTGEQPPLSLQ